MCGLWHLPESDLVKCSACSRAIESVPGEKEDIYYALRLDWKKSLAGAGKKVYRQCTRPDAGRPCAEPGAAYPVFCKKCVEAVTKVHKPSKGLGKGAKPDAPVAVIVATKDSKGVSVVGVQHLHVKVDDLWKKV